MTPLHNRTRTSESIPRKLLREGKDPSAERATTRDAQRRNVDAAFPKVAAAWLAFRLYWCG